MNDRSTFEEELLVAALALPADSRRSFIQSRCGADDDTVDRLIALAQGYQENSAYLETPAPAATLRSVGRTPAARLPEPQAGDRIDHYRLLKRIGEGGFGVVYLAEQEEPMRRLVAFKLIRLGLDTTEFIKRFEAERQALAVMDHLNIARVFDAGATDRGRPYLVMELIHGISITAYCDEHRLPIAARLGLFLQVCSAIQHAHQKGIIHRDLKPSNILVALDGSEPIPKVIDFGIAKATREPLAEKTLLTRCHSLIGTPAYTSPEQMEMSGLDVDTRSDIYSLGVLLYELLTGYQPFDRAELHEASLEEIRRIIREVEAPRPSLRVATLNDADRAAAATKRSVESAQLAPLLRSDLDWIVMRCLEKDRGRRYETANALALDILRHLENEPVVARPPSRVYQLRKFVRRHHTGVAAAAAVFVSLAGGLIASSILLARTRAAERAQVELRQQAEASAAEARLEAAKNAQVAEFMTNILGGVKAGMIRGRDTTLLSDVLDSTARRLDTELRDQPAVAAKLRDVLGAVYTMRGQFKKAEALLREAVATRRKFPGREADLAASLSAHGWVLWRLNRNVESEALLRESLEIRRRVFGAESDEVATALYQLSSPLGELGRRDEYESLRRELLVMRRRLFGQEHPAYAQALHAVGSVERLKGNLPAAEALLREALAITQKAHGNEHAGTATIRNSLGFALQAENKWTEAITAYREALSIRRRALGDIHPEVCVTLLRLAGLLPTTGQRDEAISIARDVLAGQRKLGGEEAIATAPTLLVLAALVGHDGERAGESKEMVQSAQRILEQARSAGEQLDYQETCALFYFAATLLRTGAPADGVIIAEEARRSFVSRFAIDHEETLSATEILGALHLATGKIEKAIELLEDVRRRATTTLAPNHQTLHRTLIDLGIAYREVGRLGDSQQALEEVLTRWSSTIMYSANQTPGDITRSFAQCQLAWTLNREGNFVAAEKLLREVSGGPGVTPEFPATRSLAKSLLGETLTGQRRFTEAEPLVTQGYLDLKENVQAIPGDRERELRAAIDRVTRLYVAWEKPAQAAEWQSRDAQPELEVQR